MSSIKAVSGSQAGSRVVVWVVPRSKKPGIDGFHAGCLRVRVSAPPVDGMANRAVATVIRDVFGVDPVLVSGGGNRRKVFELPGLTVTEARRCVDLAVQ